MRLPITLTTAALGFAFAAGPAQAHSAPSTEQQKSGKAVVVLIGANDYGVVGPALGTDRWPPGAAAPAQAFTPPIGTDKGSAAAATPTAVPAAPNGIIAVLIG
jgi:hypothetical protein